MRDPRGRSLRSLSSRFEYCAPDKWWFGIVALIFRLTQTSILIFFPDAVTQAAFGTVVCILFAIVHDNVKPYHSNSDHAFAMLVNWCTCAWMFTKLLIIDEVVTPLPGVLVGIALVAFAIGVIMLLLYYVSRANQHEAAQVEQRGDAPDDETPAPEDARTPTPPNAGGKARIRARSSAPASMGGGWSESESDGVQLTNIYAPQSFSGADNPMHGSSSEDDEAPEESERAQRELARESESAIATESHEI